MQTRPWEPMTVDGLRKFDRQLLLIDFTSTLMLVSAGLDKIQEVYKTIHTCQTSFQPRIFLELKQRGTAILGEKADVIS